MTAEQIAELQKKHYNASIVGLREVHSDLAIVRVKPDQGVPSHKPGQYSTLGLGSWEPRAPGCQEEEGRAAEPRLIRRAYSISSSILDNAGKLFSRDHAEWLEFYVVLVRDAAKGPPELTPRLFMLKEGARLFLGEKIAGRYNLEPVSPGDSVIFFATGTGEAPHNYMTWELLRRGHTGRILSACCVRYRRDLGYQPTHEELMRRYPNYTYLSLTTREADTAGHKVYIQDLVTSGELEARLGRPLDPERTHFYLCGNPNMIGVPTVDRATGETRYPQPKGVVQILEERGFKMDMPGVKSRGSIHFEEYW